MQIVSQTEIRAHVLQLPALALAAKFRPFALKLLAWAGVDPGAPSLDRMRAIVGWFASHAIHPSSYLHPDATVLNTAVLPVGETWATFNAAFNPQVSTDRDQAYWYALFPNGIAMLEKLIGTTAADGTVADDGMLTEYAAGQWRIRSFANYRASQCTLQCKMAQVVLAAQGIYAIDISTTGHDPMMAYENETGLWRYIDPTFGEMQKRDGVYQSPLDLLIASLDGDKAAIADEKLPGTDYLAASYFPDSTAGMQFMTIHTAPRWATSGVSDRVAYHFGTLPSLSAGTERSGTAKQLMPELGCGVAGIRAQGKRTEIRLVTNWPGHVAYQRSIDDGATWAACGSVDYPPISPTRYRSVGDSGFSGRSVVLII